MERVLSWVWVPIQIGKLTTIRFAVILWLAGGMTLVIAPPMLMIDGSLVGFAVDVTKGIIVLGYGTYVHRRGRSYPPPQVAQALKKFWREEFAEPWRERPRVVPKLESPVFLAIGLVSLVASPIGFASSIVAGLVLLVIGACMISFAVTVRLEEFVPPPLPFTHVGHQLAVTQIANSLDPADKGAIFVGLEHEKPDKPPVKLEPRYTCWHGCIAGGSGSGKSSGVETPMALQHLARGDTSVIYLFFREDKASYYRLAEFCDERRIPHTLTTVVDGVGSRLRSHYLDPAFQALSSHERTDLQLEAWGMSKSEAHGHGHWTDQNEKLLRDSHMAWPDLRSYRDHRDRLFDKMATKRAGIKSRQLELGSHTLAVMEKMCMPGVFNMTPEVGLPRSLFDNQVTSYEMVRRPGFHALLYSSFALSTTVRIAARTELRLVIKALGQLPRGRRVRYVLMFFDDCAPMVEQSLGECLTNARDLDLGCWFGIQSLTDFRNPDCDLRPTIEVNAATQIFLTAADEYTANYISRRSGLKTITLDAEGRTISNSPAGKGSSNTRQTRQIQVPRIGPDELRAVNNSRHLAVVITPRTAIAPLDGPTIIEIPPSLSEERFEELNSKPLPGPDGIRTIAAKDLPAWQPKRPQDDEDGDRQGQGASPEKPQTPPATIIARNSARSKRNDPARKAESEQAAEELRARQKERINQTFRPDQGAS